MIIGCCGFGCTGSSVITDLLHEYDNIQVFDSFEFTLSYKVDGLQDLEYHLMKQYARGESGDYAIKRFLDASHCFKTPFINKPCSGKKFYQLSQDFIFSILQLRFKGVLSADLMLSKNIFRNILAFASKKIIMPKIITKFTGKKSYIWPCRDLYFSVEPDNFYENCIKYTNSVIEAMGANLSIPVCLDQPFEGNAPEQSFPFFEDPYAIVIDRDPRDLYLDNKYSVNSPDDKFSPNTSVEDFVVYYKKIRKKEYSKNSRILRLNFESLIYDYDVSIRKIEEFLNLGEHFRKKQIFNPDLSINNTQLSRLHPNDEKDLLYIEKELKEYLFPFSNFPKPKFDGKPFVGAARKMIHV